MMGRKKDGLGGWGERGNGEDGEDGKGRLATAALLKRGHNSLVD